jgi:AcrR family transcriptional regulator
VSDIQRARLLAGAVAAVGELGYERTTVARITARARISRRTFYEMFTGREDCLAGVVDDVVSQLERELRAAALEGASWLERVRMGLWTILCFLDREPLLARVCVVEASRAGELVQGRRGMVLARLVQALEKGRPRGRAEGSGALTAEGLVGAVLAIVQARLSQTPREPLAGLLGELTGMIVLPYLGPAAARREQSRPAPATATSAVGPRGAGAGDPQQGLPMRLTYRTMRVLGCIQAQPGASNRQVAEGAGVQDQGQISKLLRRLKRLGLLENQGAKPLAGEPNAWCLTSVGEDIVQSLRPQQHVNSHAPTSTEGREPVKESHR